MGWTGNHAEFYKNGTVDRKAECDNIMNGNTTDKDGNTVAKFEVLKSAMVGSTYYAAIKRTRVDTGEEPVVFGIVCLTSVDMKDYFNFNYKDMSEDMGPSESKCPLSILKLLTKTENEYANQWRNRCREYTESKKDNFSSGNLKVGSIIEIDLKDSPINFSSLKFKKVYGKVRIENKQIKRMSTKWVSIDSFYKVSSKVLNSYFKQNKVTVIHESSVEEEKQLKENRIKEFRL